MEQKKISLLLTILFTLLVGCNIFGLIDFNLTTLAIGSVFLNNFISNSRLFSFEIIYVLLPIVILLSLYNPKKIILATIASFLTNILLLLLNNQLSQDIVLYAFNFSLLVPFYIVFRDPLDLKNQDKKLFLNYFIFITIVSTFFSFVVQSGISFGSIIVPQSKDIQAIFIDSFLQIPRSTTNYLYFFNDLINSESLFYRCIDIIYKLLPICMLMLACIEFRYKTKNRYYINSLLFAYIGSIIGVTLYFLYPITGPLYFQQIMQSSFPENPNWVNYLGRDIIGSMFPRNGMPSLHFGFALFMFLNSRGLNKYLRTFFGFFLAGTLIATVLLGEHYIIDWIISPSIIMILMSFCAVEISFKEKYKIILVNIVFMAVWYLFLWFGVNSYSRALDCINCAEFSYLMTSTLYLFIASSGVIFFFSYKKYKKITDNYLAKNQEELIIYDVFKGIKELVYIKPKNFTISCLFVLSGFAGLMYQVIFGKLLGTIFGSTSIAIYIILATYMIGLSLGAYIGGKENSKISALLKYSFCEILIAFFCLLTPVVFFFVEMSYNFLSSIYPENIYYLSMVKIMLGILSLLVTTTLMGMTTPILLKHFNTHISNSISLAHLYTLNTFGAALGALLAGYLLIPNLGIRNSVLLAVILNLLIGLKAISIFKKENTQFEKIEVYIKDFFNGFKSVFKSDAVIKVHLTLETKTTLLLLFVSGLINMSLETLFVHALAIVVGNSAYAFSIMLFTFLIGLSLGGYLGKILIINKVVGFKVISFLEVSVAFCVFIGFNLLNLVPDYLASFGSSNVITEFSQKEFVRACACFVVMLLPTIAIGTIYSLLMENLLKDFDKEQGEKVTGIGLSLNTIGNIFGIFIGGLLLINFAGLEGGMKALSILALICSLLILIAYRAKKLLLITTALLGAFLIIPFNLNMDKITSGSNVYFLNASRGKVIDYAESVDGGLTSVNIEKLKDKTQLTLLTNGKFQGNNSGEVYAQGAFAIAPLMHTEARDRALVIGYGTGMTARVIHDAQFKNVEIVDLSADIINMADKHFSDINNNVRKNTNVKTIINDGRNYLRLTSKKYDFISMELTSIWFAGASYLYNREFYQIAKTKLSNHGVLQQWVQLHHMRPQDFLVILNTVRSEFKHVSLYVIGGQGIIVATNSEDVANPHEQNIKLMNNNKALDEVKAFYNNDFASLVDDRILNSNETNRLLTNIYKGSHQKFYSTDNNLYLEYNTPKGNSVKEDTMKEIINIIDQYKR